MYVTSEEKDNFDTPFDISKIPIVTREQADAEDRTKKLTATTPTLKAPKVDAVKAPATGAEAAASASAQAQRYNEELMQIDEMKEFGSVLKSSPAVELTEAETEYVVSVVKHIFKEHIVLQFEIKNTLPDTVLDNVSVLASPADDEELEEVFIIQCDRLATNEPGKVYVAFKKLGGEGSMPTASFSNVLKFTSKEIDPSTNTPDEPGYDDEYEVSEFDLSGSDYIIPTFASNFSHLWEQVGASGDEAEETLQLSAMKSIAGKHKPLTLTKELVLTIIYRGYRTTSTGVIAAATRGHRRPRQQQHTYSQATGQDRWRRQSCRDSAHGFFIKVWCHNQDYGEKRRGGCGAVGSCIGGLKRWRRSGVVVN